MRWDAISHPPMNMGDQPALGPDGKLLDASQIEWFHDLDDPWPIQPKRSPSQLDIVEKISQRSMSLKSISNFLSKILTCVIQSDGGSVGKPSFPIYIISLAMFW